MKRLLFALLTILWTSVQASNPYTLIEDSADLEILNPSLAERKTVKLRLANGLEAYLVSDPGVEDSAAALAVEAGSWNDAEEYPGIAHFLEHLLFLGTKKYPVEDGFLPYLTERGGMVNAYTASNRTVYMFSINNSSFEDSLDRFSHFFIDPLFNPASIERELLAVDQEHAKNVENDAWRQFHVFKETGNPRHPNAKFNCGNADTLRGIPREAVIEWYEDHYSADKMHLVILSPLPMETLINLTVQDFSAIPTREVKESNYAFSMSSEEQKGQTVYIKPVKDLKELTLSWELPQDLAANDETKAGELISYVLKSGSKNSLLGLLKREQLAEEVTASQEKLGKTNKLYTLNVALTEKGLQEVDTVITYCFEALARLRKTNIPQYIYNEVEQIHELRYQYQSRSPSYEFVMRSAADLVEEKLSTYPRKTLLPTQYDPGACMAYLKSLTPEQCMIFITADPAKTGVPTTRKEKWMQAEYTVQPLSEKQLHKFCNVSINPQIGLPPPNPFIPKNLELVSNGPSEMKTPTLLQDNNNGKVYFAQDTKYLVPEVAHFFRVQSQSIDTSVKSAVLTDLYVKAVNDAAFSLTSAAEAAGAEILVKPDRLSIAVAINGYSDQSDKITEALLSTMKKVRPTKEQFALYRESLASSYENSEKDMLFNQARQTVSSLLFSDSHSPRAKREALETISFDEFSTFTKNLLTKSYVEGLLYGNITKEDADTLLTQVKKSLKSDGFPVKDHYEKRLLLLPENQGPFMIVQPTNMQGNVALLMVEQGRDTLEARACQQILSNVLAPEFFTTLRTQQQVAYIAKAWSMAREDQLMQFFTVQSASHNPNDLIGRFELFLENFVKQYTTQLSFERFESVRQNAIETLRQPPENLVLNAAQLFVMGFDYEGDFALVDKRIDALQSVTYDETRAMANRCFSRQNSKRLALLIEGLTPKERDFRYEMVSEEELIHDGTFVTKKEIPTSYAEIK